jgi:hypothetical protein
MGTVIISITITLLLILTILFFCLWMCSTDKINDFEIKLSNTKVALEAEREHNHKLKTQLSVFEALYGKINDLTDNNSNVNGKKNELHNYVDEEE